MMYQRLANRSTGAKDDIYHTFGQASFIQNFDQPQRAHRRIAGGLEDNSIAGHQRGKHLPGGNGHRKVPGRDAGNHPDGVAHGDA